MNHINFLKSLFAIPIIGSLTIKDKSKVLNNKSIAKSDLKAPEWRDTGEFCIQSGDHGRTEHSLQVDRETGIKRWIIVPNGTCDKFYGLKNDF